MPTGGYSRRSRDGDVGRGAKGTARTVDGILDAGARRRPRVLRPLVVHAVVEDVIEDEGHVPLRPYGEAQPREGRLATHGAGGEVVEVDEKGEVPPRLLLSATHACIRGWADVRPYACIRGRARVARARGQGTRCSTPATARARRRACAQTCGKSHRSKRS